VNAEPQVTEGQAGAASAGTTATAPEGSAGQSVSSGTQITNTGPDQGAIESFFDPKSLDGKPELQAAYKQMQGAFTKRMQEFAKHNEDIDLVKQFRQNPVATLQQLNSAYGLQYVPRGQDQSVEQPEFNSWDDVKSHFFAEFKKEMAPVFNEVKSLKKQNIETYLDNHHSDWRNYETEMMGILKEHPSLVGNPDMLYRMAVPPQVLEARATQAALQKIKTSGEASQVSGGSTTTKQPSQKPTGPLSFNQAVEFAKSQLASKGLRPPAG
jgi:hypothetical protein